MKTAAVIVAAGRGTRAGPGAPKQWRSLASRRVADWTLAAFDAHPAIAEIVLVYHRDDLAEVQTLAATTPLSLCHGAQTRAGSVAAGLTAIKDPTVTHVLIHDVARPCVTLEVIDRVLDGLNGSPGAAPALAVTDALWTGEHGQVSGTQDRAGLFRAQTPQGFDLKAIRQAHAAKGVSDAADDVALARAAGLAVRIVVGDERNIKITGPGDIALAEMYLSPKTCED